MKIFNLKNLVNGGFIKRSLGLSIIKKEKLILKGHYFKNFCDKETLNEDLDQHMDVESTSEIKRQTQDIIKKLEALKKFNGPFVIDKKEIIKRFLASDPNLDDPLDVQIRKKFIGI